MQRERESGGGGQKDRKNTERGTEKKIQTMKKEEHISVPTRMRKASLKPHLKKKKNNNI